MEFTHNLRVVLSAPFKYKASKKALPKGTVGYVSADLNSTHAMIQWSLIGDPFIAEANNVCKVERLVTPKSIIRLAPVQKTTKT